MVFNFRKHLFLTITVLTSCVQSKIITYTAFPKIVEGEGIILMPISELNPKTAISLYEIARKKLSNSNIVSFVPEQEYFLMSKGIDRTELYESNISDSTKNAICRYTNSRYILKVEIQNSKESDTFGSYTSLELNRFNSLYTRDNETSKARLLFTLTDTKNHLSDFRFQVKTAISPLAIDEKNGETRINISSETGAITESFKKGIRKLKQEIISR